MNTTEHPLVAALTNEELAAQPEANQPTPGARKPFVVPALMQPQDMLETTKFFFQIGGGGSG